MNEHYLTAGSRMHGAGFLLLALLFVIAIIGLPSDGRAGGSGEAADVLN